MGGLAWSVDVFLGVLLVGHCRSCLCLSWCMKSVKVLLGRRTVGQDWVMVLVKGLWLFSVHVVSVFVSKNNFSSIFGVFCDFFDA